MIDIIYRKLFFLFLLFIFTVIPINIYAGDIPEGLLNSSTATVYIGELKAKSNTDFTFIQKTSIKGNFNQNSKDVVLCSANDINYSDTLKIGRLYLVSYDSTGGISPWILEVDGTEIDTLVIKDDSNMAERMAEYIHNGSFTNSESKIVEIKESVISTQAEVNNIVNKTPDTGKRKVHLNFLIGIIIILLSLIFFIIKKKI